MVIFGTGDTSQKHSTHIHNIQTYVLYRIALLDIFTYVCTYVCMQSRQFWNAFELVSNAIITQLQKFLHVCVKLLLIINLKEWVKITFEILNIHTYKCRHKYWHALNTAKNDYEIWKLINFCDENRYWQWRGIFADFKILQIKNVSKKDNSNPNLVRHKSVLEQTR